MIIIWFIWKWQNNKIFQNNSEAFGSIIDKIIPSYFSYNQNMSQQKIQHMAPSPSPPLLFPRAHFDGAAKDGNCACGVFISFSKDHHFSIFWNGGRGTNNKAEVMTLHGLLFFYSFMEFGPLKVYGDSKAIIDHVNGLQKITKDNLTGWLHRITSLWDSVSFPIAHIKRNQNVQADALSKQGLNSPIGIWHLIIMMDPYAYEI